MQFFKYFVIVLINCLFLLPFSILILFNNLKNIFLNFQEDYSFYKIEETPDKLRLENKEGALATITLTDVQSFYDDQDMGMDEFVEMIVGFGVKELTEKENFQ